MADIMRSLTLLNKKLKKDDANSSKKVAEDESDTLLKPNKAMRRMLSLQWKKLTDGDRLLLRSKRARLGLECHICGSKGYFREICENRCLSPPPTPDSDASTPPSSPPPSPIGLGVLWKIPGEEDDSNISDSDSDLADLRPITLREKDRLRVTDSTVGIYEYFTVAEEGYNRSLPELTLHQTMRRLMRITEKLINSNTEKLEAEFDVTLLHPPSHSERVNFYPDKLSKVKEYQEYFYKQLLKNDRIKQHMYKGSNRPIDALDPLFRGSGVSIGGRDTSNEVMFTVDSEAGGSQHSKVGWKSNLAKNDQLAVSDPKMIQKMKKVKELFHRQGEWTRLQKKSMEQRNDMFEHIVSILRMEMELEHKRETDLLQSTSKVESKHANVKVWEDRFQSVDRIMQTIVAYKMTGALDEADYLLFVLNQWKGQQTGLPGYSNTLSADATAKGKGKGRGSAKTSTSTGGGGSSRSGVNPYELQISKCAKRRKRVTKVSNESVDESASLYSTVGDDDNDSVASVGRKMYNDIVSSSSMPLDESVSSQYSITSSSNTQNSNMILNSMHEAKMDSDRYFEQQKKLQMIEDAKWKPNNFNIVPIISPHKKDMIQMKKAKSNFNRAGLSTYIRKGNSDDVAYLAPTLIPVPGAFKGDCKALMKSHVAEQIIDGIQMNMTSALGHTPHSMLPLYVRNTLIEKNGANPNGDQTQDIMALDRRYSHYIGRPLNRFEPDKNVLETKVTMNALGMRIKELKPLTPKRKKQLRDTGAMTNSLVRLVFSKPPRSLTDLYFESEEQ